MRSAAEINEVAAAVHRDDSVFRNIGKSFQLILLVRQNFLCFLPADFDAFEGLVRLDQFLHFRLDGRQFFDLQVFRKIEVVVESVLRAGADIEFRFGVELFDRGRHHMGGAVADRFNRKLRHLSILS